MLVVEDDAHIRLGLCEALRAEGYDVIDCRDGAQAGLKQLILERKQADVGTSGLGRLVFRTALLRAESLRRRCRHEGGKTRHRNRTQ